MNRTHLVTVLMDWKLLLYAESFPDNDPLMILDWHSDLKIAFIGAVQAVQIAFVGAQVHLCVFHYSQSIHRKPDRVMARPTKNRPLLQVWTLLKDAPIYLGTVH